MEKDRFHFTVDSALLRELGERLVGSPGLSVGELIKNSYDADATEVSIRFEDDCLIVEDNGSGMTLDQFRDRWMRVGTRNKESQKTSAKFERPLTGSKGVGRLSVQYLGTYLELSTTSQLDQRELFVIVDWAQAVEAGDIQEAIADYEYRDRPGSYLGSESGFSVKIGRLLHKWDVQDEFERLAREIWKLSPPMGGRSEKKVGKFKVDLEGVSEGAAERFQTIMNAISDIWHAKLVGSLVRSKKGDPAGSKRVKISWEFSQDGINGVQEIVLEDCRLTSLKYEVRIFDLIGRQPHGVKVGEVREYLDQHGGIRIFDAGFGLSHYGLQTDWLNIERDHSHRLSRSKLLPSELQISEGMNNLPTQDRIMGEVHINTKAELSRAGKKFDPDTLLSIAVTRDRLLDNKAFRNLADAVRIGTDLYAMEETKRRLELAQTMVRATGTSPEAYSDIKRTLETVHQQIPEPVFNVLNKQVDKASKAVNAERDILRQEKVMLGTLATAGITALAFEHEAVKQYKSLATLVSKLRKSSKDSIEIKKIAGQLEEWVARSQQTRAIFLPYMDEENRDVRVKIKLLGLISNVVQQSQVYLREIKFDLDGIPKRLQLPAGTLAEWTAIFQNVLVNAANSMAESKNKLIRVSTQDVGGRIEIYIQDTGQGVDLSRSEELFNPFVRRMKINQKRLALGAGGTGMGLTIVRMLAEEMGIDTSFVDPEDGFSACFVLSWDKENG